MILIVAALLAQAVTVEAPASVAQGNTIRVRLAGDPALLKTVRLRFEGRTVPVFPDSAGAYLGLIPVPVALAPGKYAIEWLDAGGAAAGEKAIVVTDARFPRQNIRVTKEVEGLKPLPGEMETIRAVQEKISPQRLWTEPFTTPTPGCMSSPFGVSRYHNGKFTGSYHKGVDIRAPEGQPVRAIAGGEVRIGTMYRLHGGTVGIDHGQGVVSVYIHLSRVAARDGQRVAPGDVIGYVGHTGFATGPHLHWGLYVNGLPVNSRQWIKGVTACR